MADQPLSGRTALITGASRGIGAATARALDRAGARVAISARGVEELTKVASELHHEPVVIGADLARADAPAHLARQALDQLGRVDILVNNAATVEPLGVTANIPAVELRRAFELNVIAPAALTAAVLPGMLAAGWGRIVNVSSGIVARPGFMVRGNAYAATKAALEAHTVNLAAELSGTGVTVNAYRPGGVDTAMQAWIRGQEPDRIGTALHTRFNQNFAEGTLITPERSAAALIAHLAGDESGSIWDVSDASTRA
jgi:NAD(P)-dependent dehydrogenase (short-subunit alcohol dehydrogenase family)